MSPDAATPDAAGAHGDYDYAAFSELTGPFQEPPVGQPYEVRYRNLSSTVRQRGQALVLTVAALTFELVFLLWLLQPAHWPDSNTSPLAYWTSVTLVSFTGLIEFMRLVNVTTLCLATLRARDPIPVRPEAGLRVAFTTTIVPSKEPLELARQTLAAAMKIRHDGVFDVWLLDEGDDPAVKAMCAELGVHHFSRKGVDRWNQETGQHRAKTKHGNYNAWLEAHGYHYDAWVSVDVDHVPMPNFAERLLGYLRDPDVAFVVGPQVYGNYDNFMTRAAESQQYLFHSVLQRAANRHGSAMFVGTNNAVRISALLSIGGMQDSITEDAMTSIVWHGSTNPETGRKWKSVYTPDVLAVGEGPTSWTDYFTQQHRWARGTNEVMFRRFWQLRHGLSVGRRTQYALLMSYYPSAALGWILGSLNLMVYLLTGIGGLQVAAGLWFNLYVNAAVLQVLIYFWNRRHNVSPHEESGSSGVSGMFVSILSAPIYVTALVDAVLNRTSSFVITPKGESGNADGIRTFSKSIGWGLAMGLALLASYPLHNDHPAMRIWAVLAVVTCLLPLFIWQVALHRGTGPGATGPVTPPAPMPLTTTTSTTTGATPPLSLPVGAPPLVIDLRDRSYDLDSAPAARPSVRQEISQ